MSLRGLSIQLPDKLYSGQSIQAIGLTIPADSDAVITWVIDYIYSEIASVTSSGFITVTAVIPSVFTLRISSGNYSESVNIDVLANVTSITFDTQAITTSIGYTIPTIPNITWTDGLTGLRGYTVTYISSLPSTATIDSTGRIQAKKNGTTEITASITTNMTYSATTIVNVVTRPNINNTIIGSDGTIYTPLIFTGKISQAYLVIQPWNVTVTSVVWSSSDISIIYIDPTTGLIIGVSTGGPVTISATVTNINSSHTFNINNIYCVTAIDTIMLTPRSILGIQLNTEYTGILSQILSFYPRTTMFSTPTWLSLDPTIATVDSDYENDTLKIKGISSGNTSLIVQSGDINAVSTMMNISVQNGLLNIISDIPNTILIGKTFQAIIAATGTNLSISYYSSSEWSSGDITIATVSSSGLITGISAGTTIIYLTLRGQSGTQTYNKTINVLIGVQYIVLSPYAMNLQIGNTLTISANVFPSNANNTNVTWKSSKSTIATISTNGIVTGITSGTIVITATAGDGSGVSQHVSVNVGTPITSVSISNPTGNILYVGSTIKTTISISPTTALSDFVYWNPKTTPITTYEINTIEQVTDTGVIIPGGVGTSTFNVYTGNQYGDTVSTVSQTFTVVIPVIAVSLTPIKMTMSVGTNSAITANIFPANATTPGLSWRSDNNLIAYYSTGRIYAVSPGLAYITIRTVDGTNKTATTIIIVS
jgi:uncharacterized protein YjdB